MFSHQIPPVKDYRAIAPTFPPQVNWQWIVDEGHIDCAALLAEQAATVMAIEHVRLSVALDEGNAKKCLLHSVLSESRSSAHTRQIAKVWAEGLVNGPNIFGDATSKRVYQLTEKDIPK